MKIINKRITFLVIFIIIFLSSIIYLGFKNQSGHPTYSVVNNQSSYSSTSNTVSYAESKEIKLLFVGDIMLARTIGTAIKNNQNPFINVKDNFFKYDLVVGNLETNVSSDQIGTKSAGKLFTFKAPLESLDVLKQNNIGLVSLANNHTMDYGPLALQDMLKKLNNKGIPYVGAGNNLTEAYMAKYFKLSNTTIGFLAFNDIENWVSDAKSNMPGSAYFNEELIVSSIKETKKNCDILIIIPHWGIEYNLQNSERQKYFANLFVKNGADLIVGAHPHVLQNSENIQQKQVYYSLGNFVFDGMNGIPNADKGAMLEVKIVDKKITDTKLIKTYLDSKGFPNIEK